MNPTLVLLFNIIAKEVDVIFYMLFYIKLHDKKKVKNSVLKLLCCIFILLFDTYNL